MGGKKQDVLDLNLLGAKLAGIQTYRTAAEGRDLGYPKLWEGPEDCLFVYVAPGLSMPWNPCGDLKQAWQVARAWYTQSECPDKYLTIEACDAQWSVDIRFGSQPRDYVCVILNPDASDEEAALALMKAVRAALKDKETEVEKDV